MDDTKNNLSTEDLVSNQPGSGKVAGDYEIEMKLKPGSRGDGRNGPSLVFAKKTKVVPEPEQPRSDSDLPLNHSIFIPDADTSTPAPFKQKIIRTFKTRGHCGEDTCVPCSTPNCLKCFSCLHKERRSENFYSFIVDIFSSFVFIRQRCEMRLCLNTNKKERERREKRNERNISKMNDRLVLKQSVGPEYHATKNNSTERAIDYDYSESEQREISPSVGHNGGEDICIVQDGNEAMNDEDNEENSDVFDKSTATAEVDLIGFERMKENSDNIAENKTVNVENNENTNTHDVPNTDTVEVESNSPELGKDKGSAKNPLYKCPKCGKSYKKKAYAKVHCNQPSWWRCDKCGQKVVNRQNIKRHITRCNRRNEGTRTATEKPVFRCLVCGEMFASNSNLLKHKRVAHKEDIGDQHCSYENCDFVTSKSKYLKKHVTSKHVQGPGYKCGKCEYECFSSSGLRRHMISDHGVKCKHCDKVCESEERVRLHSSKMHEYNM